MEESPRIRTAEEHELDVLLKDGSTVHLRPIRPDDDDMMIALFNRFSPRTIYLRFHHVIREMTKEEVQRYTRVDYRDTFALIATLGEPPDVRIIAVGRYARLANPDRAEAAFVVEDSHQGRGISTHLLDQLAAVARSNGIRVFEAEVMSENREMMEVFRDSGFPLETTLEEGTYHVVFPIETTSVMEERVDLHEQVAVAASIRAFFHPNSVAVIGASRRRQTIGGELFQNILKEGFQGVVYPINPKSPVVGAVRAYPSVLDVPDDIDLAIVVVPAEQVIDVASQCARKGVRAMVVISAGFRETDAEGLEREKALVAKIRSHGMRLIGPNCMGILNTDPAVSLNATFSPIFPPRGNVALLSQSGALGLALLDYARELNIGLSTFVSIGNRADVSANDLIQYWEQDPDTDVILLYLESFGNPRRFARVARRISSLKPIIAVKSGRTSAGSRAASSHTGALASLDIASDALFRQAGVTRVDTLQELFDVANLLAHQPTPKGKRVAIVTNGGGPGILAADACEGFGLEVPPLREEVQKALRDFLPPLAGVSNPIDMLAAAGAEDYAHVLRLLFQEEDIDSVIMLYIPPLVTVAETVAVGIRDAAAEYWGRKTLLACFMSSTGAPAELAVSEKEIIPSFTFPEAAAAALARACEYADWRARPKGAIPKLPDVRLEEARQIVESTLAASDGPAWLSNTASAHLLDAYGIRSAKIAMARSPEEAATAATAMGFPVAVKLASSTITHKSDIGGVNLNLRSEAAVREAFSRMRDRLRAIGRLAEMDGVVVQQMVPTGIEAIVGVTQDPSFGPLIMFGLGGIYVEMLKDVVFRIHPLTDLDAKEMIRSIKGYPLLTGWRGADAGDLDVLEDLLLRVSAMVEDLPEIAEMDFNPVKVLPPGQGCMVVDTRILLRNP
jgi:acetyl coenzyme A synthetase (ADP forming)-like protein